MNKKPSLFQDSEVLQTTSRHSPLDKRIISHYPQIRAIHQGEIPLPRMAILYPTYGCNLDCVGCEYSSENVKGIHRLPTERALVLIDELASMGVEAIELCGGGEPLLHPDIPDWVKRGGERNIRFGALTNGTAFSQRFLEESLPHFSYIRVTFDAADSDMYHLVRPSKGQNPWNKLLHNFKSLVQVKREKNLNLELSTKFLISKLNGHQLAEMVELAHDLGASSAQFKALRLSPEELSPEKATELDQELNRLRALKPDFPIVGTFQKIQMTRQCQLTPLQVTIDAYGEVYLCCYFLHRKEKHSIGNIHKSSLADLWGSVAHRQSIAGIEPKSCSNLDCRFVRYHEIMDDWMGPEEDRYSFI